MLRHGSASARAAQEVALTRPLGSVIRPCDRSGAVALVDATDRSCGALGDVRVEEVRPKQFDGGQISDVADGVNGEGVDVEPRARRPMGLRVGEGPRQDSVDLTGPPE